MAAGDVVVLVDPLPLLELDELDDPFEPASLLPGSLLPASEEDVDEDVAEDDVAEELLRLSVL